VSQDEFRKDVLGARSPADEEGGYAAPQHYDPSTEPTVSSARLDPVPTQPTRIDPDAPIHRGAAAASSGRPSGRNHVALPAGYVFHEYVIESVLGTGGFGITYLARDNNLQCPVAIKEYLPNDLAVRTDGQTVCARTESDTHGYRIGLDGFLAEARVLATFRHPHIVRVTRFFEANNTAYMVMDYERGQPLRDWIRAHGPIGESRLLELFLPLLDGLEVVHKARVLHRDIKPANIYVREDAGGLVLLDFGAARYARSDDSRSLTSIVTPGYAPFEQYHAHGAQGPWSDLYAMGGVLYWIVTGEKPMEAPSRVRHDAMPTARALGEGRYGERLLRAIDWALTPDEAERPRSVAEFKAVLSGEREAPPLSSPPSLPEPKASRTETGSMSSRKPWAFAAAAVVLAAAAAALYPGARDPGPEDVGAPPPAAPPTEAPAVAEKAATPGPAVRKRRSAPAARPPARSAAAGESAAVEKPKVAAAAMATVLLRVTPQGEIVLDGKKHGISPPLTRLPLTTGVKHKLEIHPLGGMALPHYWTLELKPGETREISANFERTY
jgi:serine/threonine protein kinase